jgi:hypothetical protein
MKGKFTLQWGKGSVDHSTRHSSLLILAVFHSNMFIMMY